MVGLGQLACKSDRLPVNPASSGLVGQRMAIWRLALPISIQHSRPIPRSLCTSLLNGKMRIVMNE
jgi:hypothetical protein